MQHGKHLQIQFNTLLFIIALLTCVTTTMAQTPFEVNGIRYEFINEDDALYFLGFDGTLKVVAYIDEDGDYYYHYKGDIVIPQSVTYNGSTYSVTAIGEYAFEECTELTSVEMPNSIIAIAPRAFSGCTSLRSVTIPNSVTTIGTEWNDIDTGCQGTFMDCTGLEEITIGKSVNFIGTCTFRLGYENSLKKVTCLATIPPETVWGFSGEEHSPRTPIGIFDDFFTYWTGESSDPYGGCHVVIYDNVYYQATLYVPKGSVEAYRNAEDWGRFVNIVGIDVPVEPFVDVCDVNGDGVVNISDLNNVVNDILSDKSDPVMDVNGDGSVNISDINTIVQTILSSN